MKAAEITDYDSLKAWLEEQPKEVSVWIAARAAARVLPVWWRAVLIADWARERDLSALPVLRCLLISAVAAKTTTDDIKAAARVADPAAALYVLGVRQASAAAALAGANAAASAAGDAAAVMRAVKAAESVADAARAGAAAVWESIRNDAAHVAKGVIPADRPLWPEGMPAEIAEACDKTRTALTERIAAGETGWQFWLDWYEAQLSGAPQNWEMLKEIALIPDDDWKQGAVHVNGLIEEIVERYRGGERSALSQAFPVDFTFDSLARVMRMVGIVDDMAHLRDPAVVQSFLDDCGELRDSLQDFADYADAGRDGKNRVAMLHLAASKVLNELLRTRDTDHLRARHIVQLAGRLEAFSKEEGAREELGETLSTILEDSIGLLRTVTRKHFGPAYTALAPLGQLTLDHVDQDEVVTLFDQMIARLEALPSDELVALDEDGLSVFRDMIRELHEFRAAIAEASSDDFRQVLEQRFAESIGGTGLAFGRFIETSSAVAGQGARGVDGAVKTYKRVQNLGDIKDFIFEFLNLGATP